MDFGRKYVKLGQYEGMTHEVSEGRAEMLSKILTDIETETAKYPSYSDIPRKVLGDMRKRKAEALIDFEGRVPDSFYEGKDYPVSVVEDVLLFFTTYVGRV